jgi:hypothetical protein
MRAYLAPRPTAIFVFTLWIALATALLCAVLPAGLPLTKSIGSAFNPASKAVALRGRAEQVRAPAKRIVKDDPAPSEPLTLSTVHAMPIPSIAPVPAPAIVAAPAPAYFSVSQPGIGQWQWRSVYPRGPPAP